MIKVVGAALMKEEFSITITIENFVATDTYTYSFGVIELSVYTAKWISGDITLNEHEDAIWLCPEELDQLEWAPVDVKAVNALQNMYA